MRYLDMLTRLGIGSAHPGGFSATLEQFRKHPLPAGNRILEIGCGTGRTACYLARQGFTVTGLDIRSEMLAKAAQRSASEQLSVTWVEGSATFLPFDNESFDIVLAESVTNFVHIPTALAEYRRVLRAGGMLYDREVIALDGLDENASRGLIDFFEFESLLTHEAWIQAIREAGFSKSKTLEQSAFHERQSDDYFRHPDQHQTADPGAMLDPALWKISLRHDELIHEHRHHLGYALFQAVR